MAPFYAFKERLRSRLTGLLRSLTPRLPEWIDAPANGCDDETSFATLCFGDGPFR
jgi:hypothetical protein